MAKKIGLFGGTFDPIHFGHLNLAREMEKKHHLDEIWFIPAHVNPHKKNHVGSASITDRMVMVHLAVQGIPNFIVKDFEAVRPPPSYTIDTVRHFLKEEPHHQFYLIMGQDTLQGFPKWHEPFEIVKLIPLLIGLRSHQDIISEGFDDLLLREAIQKGLTQTRMMDVSATDIRKRLSQGLECDHLVPKPVLDYIRQHHLYKN